MHVRLSALIPGLLAAVCCVIYVTAAIRQPDAVSVALAFLSAVMTAAAPFWRTRRVTAGIVIICALAAWSALFWWSAPDLISIPPYLLLAPMVVYSWTRWQPDAGWGHAALAIGAVGALASPVNFNYYWKSGLDLSWAVLQWLILLVVYLVAARSKAQAAEQADLLAMLRQRNAALEREAAQQRTLATQLERNKIATEIHDVLAHSLTLIHAEATAGIVSAKTDPGAATDALGEVRSATTQALQDVRGIVAMLRTDDQTAHAPAGDLRNLPTVVERFRSGGLNLVDELPNPDVLERKQAELSTLTRLATMRIVEEGLTNALRYGDPGQEVRLHLVIGTSIDEQPTYEQVEVSIVNQLAPGPTPSPAFRMPLGTGTGLSGLAERAAALGGYCRADDANGVWTLRAILPAVCR